TIPAITATSTRTTTPKPSDGTRRASSWGAPALLVVVAWILFAFGGRDLWADAIFIAAAVLLTLVFQPRFSFSHRVLDVSVCLRLAFRAAQLVPLPPSLRFALSPASIGVDRAILLTPPTDPYAGPLHPLTLDIDATVWSLAIAGAAVLLFWSARATFER